MNIAGLAHSMAGVRNDLEFGFRPGLFQCPGVAEGRDDVIAPVHDRTWYATNAIDLSEQPAIVLQETAIEEIVAFNAREREGVLI